MRMTPRRRVREALSHRVPDRVPFSWNFGPTPEMRSVLVAYAASLGVDWGRFEREVDDIRTVAPLYIGAPLPQGTDIWGIHRRAQSYGAGTYDEIAVYPLAGVQDPHSLGDYPWPDPDAYDDAGFHQQLLADDPDGYRARKLAISVCGNPFEVYCWMTGLEEAMVNVLINPALVHAALGHITGFFEARMHRVLSRDADLMDILYFADDLGGQRTLLMSRRAYHQVLQPYHHRLFALGKRSAPHAAVMFHSDGAVFDVLPDLLEAGVEVLEAVQVDADGMQPERLKAVYASRLCFHGGISVQALLPRETPAAVAAECRRLVGIFGTGGGYIAAPTHAVQVGTPPENVLAMLRAVLGEEDYHQAWERAAFVPRPGSI